MSANDELMLGKNYNGAARVVLWKLIGEAARATYLVQTGTLQPVWTENFFCAGRRPDVALGETRSRASWGSVDGAARQFGSA
jgi:hypothetical protein